MKQLMKIGIASTLGLALAIPACAQNESQPTNVNQGQKPILIGSLGTTSTTSGTVVTVITAGMAEAISSTGHTK